MSFWIQMTTTTIVTATKWYLDSWHDIDYDTR